MVKLKQVKGITDVTAKPAPTDVRERSSDRDPSARPSARSGGGESMDAVLWIIAVILVIAGVVSLIRGEIAWAWRWS